MVETTRNYTSIDKDTYLIAERIAEDIGFLVLGMLGIGPLEHTVIFDVKILRQLPSIVTLRPWTRLILGNQILDIVVGSIVSTLVPQTKNDENTF